MADIKTREQRSQNMAAIKSRDTTPEVWLRKQLFARGYRYRKNVNSIIGHPDLWLPKYNVVVFVHGCFWHRHNSCKYAYMPKSRIEFWSDKFQKNLSRDSNVKNQLAEKGIRQLVVWECSIKSGMKCETSKNTILSKIDIFLHGNQPYLEL